MRHLFSTGLFLALAIPAVADDKEDALKKINGTYDLVSASIGGNTLPKKAGNVTVTIKDGAMTIHEADNKKEETSKFTIDATKTPHAIDFMPEGKNETLKGIYELKETDKGTELTIAMALEMAERPKEFKTDAINVLTFKLLRKKTP